MIVGRSSHSADETAAAADEPGVDYFCVGPVLADPDQARPPGARPGPGPDVAARAARPARGSRSAASTRPASTTCWRPVRAGSSWSGRSPRPTIPRPPPPVCGPACPPTSSSRRPTAPRPASSGAQCRPVSGLRRRPPAVAAGVVGAGRRRGRRDRPAATCTGRRGTRACCARLLGERSRVRVATVPGRALRSGRRRTSSSVAPDDEGATPGRPTCPARPSTAEPLTNSMPVTTSMPSRKTSAGRSGPPPPVPRLRGGGGGAGRPRRQPPPARVQPCPDPVTRGVERALVERGRDGAGHRSDRRPRRRCPRHRRTSRSPRP